MRRPLGLFVATVLAVACGGGGSPAGSLPPARPCGLTVWYQPSSNADEVFVVGSWDGWARPGTRLAAGRSDGWRVTRFDLPAGDYAYGIVDDGVWVADPSVPVSTYYQGIEVAWVRVGGCEAPAVTIRNAAGSAGGSAMVSASFFTAQAGDVVDPASVSVTSATGESIDPGKPVVDARAGSISFSVNGLSPGKHAFLVSAKDTAGRAADAARATVWIEPRPFDWRDAVIYEIMVDRYRGPGGAPLTEPSLLSARAGGHVDGIRAAIESGALTALGVNTLWLTPLYANPTGLFPGDDGHEYSSYHGYWPSAPRSLEPTIADDPSLQAMVAQAHAHDIRVLFDVVPHHVHEQHPYVTEHMPDWFVDTDGSCVCGIGSCDWTTHIEDCWFAPYLPSLDWQLQAVADQVSEDVRWWLDTYDADGIRIDAVPMMPRAANRRIAWELRSAYDHPGNETFLLGENYVGPTGYGLIRYDLGPFGLDSEFHFPLLWALRDAIATETGTMTEVEAAIAEGESAWDGSGAVMSTIIGNHDVPRFATVAAGDGGGDNWTPAPQSTDPTIYAKQALALGITFALPGAPTIYYGDEVGLAGHADPDARRVMPADADLNVLQVQTRAAVSGFAAARACSLALRRGTYRTLFVDDEHLVFARELAGASTVVAVITRSPTAPTTVPLAGITDGNYVDLLSGAATTVSGGAMSVGTSPLTIQLYVTSSDACVPAP